GTGLESITVRRLLHTHRRAAAENVGHEASVMRIEVLHHGDGGRKVRGQRREKYLQSAEPTGRRRDRDHVQAWSRHRRAERLRRLILQLLIQCSRLTLSENLYYQF